MRFLGWSVRAHRVSSIDLAVYAPRDPRGTVWNQVLRAHLETYLEAEKDAEDLGSGVPDFVEHELRAAASCGDLALGFLRVACVDCHHERLVPYSCHARAACPSCGARRMAEIGATLVDAVLPDVPIRHWIVTPPFELQALLLASGDLVTALASLAVSAIFRHLEVQGRALGIRGGKGGAVVFVQRASSTMRPFLHLHILVLDGLYTKAREDEPPVFHALVAPEPHDEEGVSADICSRAERLLRRRGLVDPDRKAASAIERWYARAIELRTELVAVDEGGRAKASGRGRGSGASTGEWAGFSVNARHSVECGDREGRERLARYAAKPPFADARLSWTSDGRIAVELPARRRASGTHVLLEPLALIRRVAWMIPPPARHMLIYRGVLAPAAKWRAEIVPIQVKTAASPAMLVPVPGSADIPHRSHNQRIAWARLLKRAFGVDALACERCGGRMRVIAAIIEPAVVKNILDHLGLPSSPAKLTPPRWPP